MGLLPENPATAFRASLLVSDTQSEEATVLGMSVGPDFLLVRVSAPRSVGVQVAWERLQAEMPIRQGLKDWGRFQAEMPTKQGIWERFQAEIVA